MIVFNKRVKFYVCYFIKYIYERMFGFNMYFYILNFINLNFWVLIK